jgi:HlyD family type I secretion membrane fusion protein
MTSRTGQDIATSLAQERRPRTQIGSDVDYGRVTRGVRMMLAGIIGLVVVFLVLSVVIEVEEVARARGEFIPVQRVQVIQTPEGGAIESVHVRNGDRVSSGQVIATFRAAELQRDLERTAARLAYLHIQIERLDAFAAQRTPDLAQFEEQHPEMVREALSLHAGQVRELESGLRQLDRQIDEENSAMAAARLEIPAAKSSLNASQELLLRVRQGAANGVIPRNRVAQVEEQAAQAQRTHTQLVTSLDLHAARVQRLEAEREALIARSAADARGQRADLIEQRDELRATEAAYRSRSRDIEVRAPVNGIVQKISETPVGTVIPAGGTVCEIVPTDGGVLIQARVSPRDIGFVSVGQKANVKSDAFDYSRFGTIPGEVARIAATNTPGELGQAPYIAVEIELDRPYVGTNETHVVTPGMTGEATILTGEKTVFQYLLKPIYTTLDTALHER